MRVILIYIVYILPLDQCQFASLIDWIPILSDSENNIILINLNSESLYHQKFALCYNDDYRQYMFYIIRKTTSIQNIISEIIKISIETHDKSPIKTIMNNRNMKLITANVKNFSFKQLK